MRYLRVHPVAAAAALLLPSLVRRALARPGPRAVGRVGDELADAVAARRHADATVQALLDAAPAGIVIVDALGRVARASAQAARLCGYAHEALVGTPLSALVPDAAVLRELHRRRAPIDVAVRRHDGSEIALEIVARRVGDGARTLVLVLRDVSERGRTEPERTDRLRAEIARAQAEVAGQRSSFLAEASRVLAASLQTEATLKSMARVAVPYLADYVIVDVLESDGRLRRVTAAHREPALETALAAAPACTPEPDDGSALVHVLAGGEPMLVRDITDEWLAGRPRDARHLGGATLRPTSLMLVPLRARGRMLGVVAFILTGPGRRYTLGDLAIAEELAERAALAADNARLFREAQDASRAKDEFLAVLSHELRTPLTPVLGWIRMLRAGTLKPEAEDRALEAVERNTRLQLQLVDDLLDVSRIITGTLHLHRQAVSLDVIVAAASDAIARAAAEKSITLTRRIAPGLPLIDADATRLQQVVGNLLSNAVKFTPPGGRVEVSADAEGERVRLVVCDTGEGLRADVAPHIFERFRQADSTLTRQYGGLGLGLAIVRHIVELHGGRVEATSPGPGLGTTVSVRLPIARSVVSTAASRSAPADDDVTATLRELRHPTPASSPTAWRS
ncbi:MAG TPA: ATP-binding protein [Methylomirabilota bacterium]|jgi:PAS domain S-box-containing protein|nr:ATP-binding protein [Methylomirabilota bacterium]